MSSFRGAVFVFVDSIAARKLFIATKTLQLSYPKDYLEGDQQTISPASSDGVKSFT